MGKYDLLSAQTTYQLGSNDQVLINKLGITNPAEMDEAELLLLKQLYIHTGVN